MAEAFNNIPRNFGMRRVVVVEEERTNDAENEQEDTIEASREKLERQMSENVADLISTIRNDLRTHPQATNVTSHMTDIKMRPEDHDANLHMAENSNECSFDSYPNSGERQFWGVSPENERSMPHTSQKRDYSHLVTYDRDQLPRCSREDTGHHREDGRHHLEKEKEMYKFEHQYEGGEAYVPSKKRQRSHLPPFRRANMGHHWRVGEAVMEKYENKYSSQSSALLCEHPNEGINEDDIPSESICKGKLAPSRRENIDHLRDIHRQSSGPLFEKRYEHDIPIFQQHTDSSPSYRRGHNIMREGSQDESVLERPVGLNIYNPSTPYGHNLKGRDQTDTLSMGHHRSHLQRNKRGSIGEQWDDDGYTLDCHDDNFVRQLPRPPYGDQPEEEEVGIPGIRQHRSISPLHRRRNITDFVRDELILKSHDNIYGNQSADLPIEHQHEGRDEVDTPSTSQCTSHLPAFRRDNIGGRWEEGEAAMDKYETNYGTRSADHIFGNQYEEEDDIPRRKLLGDISPPYRKKKPIDHLEDDSVLEERSGNIYGNQSTEPKFEHIYEGRDVDTSYLGQRRSHSPRLWPSERSSSNSQGNIGEYSGNLSRIEERLVSNCGSTVSSGEREESDDTDVRDKKNRRLSDKDNEANELEGNDELLLDINYGNKGDQCERQDKHCIEESSLSVSTENQRGRWGRSKNLDSPDSGSVQSWSTRHDSSRNRRKSHQSFSPEMGHHPDDWHRDRSSRHSLDRGSETDEPHHSVGNDGEGHTKHHLDSHVGNEQHSSRRGAVVEEDERDILGLFQHAMDDLRTKCEREENPALRRALLSSWKDHERECLMFLLQPDVHPNYDKEYQIYLYQQTKNLYEVGTDPDSYDYHLGWKNYWPHRMSELFQESWKKKVYKCMSNHSSEISTHFSIDEFQNEDMPASSKIVQVLKVIDHLKDRFGDLKESFTKIFKKALALEHDNLDSNSIISEDFPLLEKIGEKMVEIASDKNFTLLQKAIIQESYERFKCILKMNNERLSKKHELDISTIGRTTMGQDAHSILTFIKDSLSNIGHKNVPHKKLVKIYMEVKKEQYKINESCSTIPSSSASAQSGINVSKEASFYNAQMASMIQWQKMPSFLPPLSLMSIPPPVAIPYPIGGQYPMRGPYPMGVPYPVTAPYTMGAPYSINGPNPVGARFNLYTSQVGENSKIRNVKIVLESDPHRQKYTAQFRGGSNRVLRVLSKSETDLNGTRNVNDKAKQDQNKQEHPSSDTRLDGDASVEPQPKLQKKGSSDTEHDNEGITESDQKLQEVSSDTELEDEGSMGSQPKMQNEASDTELEDEGSVESVIKLQEKASSTTKLECEDYVKLPNKIEKEVSIVTEHKGEGTVRLPIKLQEEASPGTNIKCEDSVELPKKIEKEMSVDAEHEGEGTVELPKKMEKEFLIVTEHKYEETDELSKEYQMEASPDIKLDEEFVKSPNKIKRVNLAVQNEKKATVKFVKKKKMEVPKKLQKKVVLKPPQKRGGSLKASIKTKKKETCFAQIEGEKSVEPSSKLGKEASETKLESEVSKDLPKKLQDFSSDLKLEGDGSVNPLKKKEKRLVKQFGRKKKENHSEKKQMKNSSEDGGAPSASERKITLKEGLVDNKNEPQKIKQLSLELDQNTVRDCLHSPSTEDTSEIKKVDLEVKIPISTDKSMLQKTSLFGANHNNVNISEESSEPETSASTHTYMEQFSKKPTQIVIPQFARKVVMDLSDKEQLKYSSDDGAQSTSERKNSLREINAKPEKKKSEPEKIKQLPPELYRYTIRDCLHSPSKEDTSTEMVKLDLKTLECPVSTEKSMLLNTILFGPRESNESETSASVGKSEVPVSKKPIKIIIPQSSEKKFTHNYNPIVDDHELL